MRKSIYILLLMFPLSFAMAQESEPEFIKLLKERFKTPVVAERVGINTEILLKVKKTTNFDSISIEYNKARVFESNLNITIKDSLLKKVLPLGEYFIFLYANTWADWKDGIVSSKIKTKAILDIIKDAKVYYIEYSNKRREHDSLLSQYITSPETIWNSNKLPFNYRNKKRFDIDSGETLLVLDCYPSFRIKLKSYQMIFKRDSSIILKILKVDSDNDSTTTILRLSKNEKTDNILYRNCFEYIKIYQDFPYFNYPLLVNDGASYYVSVYRDGYYRRYGYSNPDCAPDIKLYALFDNLITYYIKLFEF